MTPVRLDPAALRSRVKHSTTEPLRSLAALIFYNITRCYGKHVAAFAVAVATGDIIKYQSFVYGSFVWGIHVRYNNTAYICTYMALGKVYMYMAGDMTDGKAYLHGSWQGIPVCITCG